MKDVQATLLLARGLFAGTILGELVTLQVNRNKQTK